MSEPIQPQLVFELTGGPSPGGQELLGPWSLFSTPTAEAVLFSTGPARQQDGAGNGPTLWRADLPADPRLASRRLTLAGEDLAVSRHALAKADIRLDAASRRAARRPPGVSFAPGTALDAPRPERELDRFLHEIGGDRAAVDFGLREEIAGAWVRFGEEFQAFVRRVEQQVGHFAWVETRSQDRLLARTEVDWTGDSDTFWCSPLVPDQVELHRRTLALALESRQELLHTIVIVSRNAARLAKLPILLGTPGGALLAAVAAYKFIQDVRVELDARRSRAASVERMPHG